MTELTAQEVIKTLGLEPLPVEGGMFRLTHINDHSSSIYYLTAGDDVSAMHVLDTTEIWNWYAGAPLQMLMLHEDGTVEEPVLGPDLRAGQRPQYIAPTGSWMGASSAGEWTLVGTTTAPAYRTEGFTIGDRAELIAAYPDAAERITELTRVAD